MSFFPLPLRCAGAALKNKKSEVVEPGWGDTSEPYCLAKVYKLLRSSIFSSQYRQIAGGRLRLLEIAAYLCGGFQGKYVFFPVEILPQKKRSRDADDFIRELERQKGDKKGQALDVGIGLNFSFECLWNRNTQNGAMHRTLRARYGD